MNYYISRTMVLKRPSHCFWRECWLYEAKPNVFRSKYLFRMHKYHIAKRIRGGVQRLKSPSWSWKRKRLTR